uniref:XdhC family protein n=1 Tax=Nonomuraea bangladeshensis TaxID=404385 RepID=UPI003F495652
MTGVRSYGEQGQARGSEVSVYVESHARPPKMLIFGAVDFSAALARMAKLLGYHVIVCDARATFATRKRFPMADEVIVEWPDRILQRLGKDLSSRDAVCVLTHDAKFDVPAIMAALETGVGYLGAMGSRRTHRHRLDRLRQQHVSEEGLSRLRSPIGLDIGARTAEEVAISILGEIISLRAGRRVTRPLTETDGPIHDERAFEHARLESYGPDGDSPERS